MEIMALNESFLPEGLTKLRYFDLVWDRKYYEAGRFMVQIRASDYSDRMKYLFTMDRPELGVIQKVVYQADEGMVEMSGFFYEKRLADKIIYPTFARYGTRTVFVAEAVKQYKGDIPKLAVAEYTDEGERIQKQETWITLEEMAYSTLQVENKAYRCAYDYKNDVIWFEIYQGVDRTQGQKTANFVTFSRGFRNIQNVRAQSDSSAFKNYFVVGGQGEGTDRIIEVLDLSGGTYRQELFIDSRKPYDAAKQTIEEYRSSLVQVAVERAQKQVVIYNVEFDAMADTGARYLEDYDLGDKCDIILDQIKMSYEARIIEVMETWSGGEHRVTLTFGDKIPTLYEKVRIKG